MFGRALVLRTLLVWSSLRAVVTALAAGNPGRPRLAEPASALLLGPTTVLLLTGFVLATVMIDARVRKEDQFLAGLGTSRTAMGVVITATVALAETAVLAVAVGGRAG